MLFRSQSNASTRIRRSKSSASVKTHHGYPSDAEVIDLVRVRHEALLAASLAFEQAGHGRKSGGLARANSTASIRAEPQPGLSRRQSIRFSGPTAVNQRRLTRSTTAGNASVHRASSTRSADGTGYGHYGVKSDFTHESEIFAQSAAPEYEYYTAEDDVASAPSSYRKLRKSKSMFTSTRPGHVNSRGERGFASIRANRPEAGIGLSSRTLKAPKSLSVLRVGRHRGRPSFDQHHEAAVHMAREKYRQQHGSQAPDERTSFALSSSARREQKAFRKTVRTTGYSRYGSTVAPEEQKKLPKKGLVVKARSISVSLKSKLKRVFHRSSGDIKGLPVQQLDATCPYFGDDFDGDFSLQDNQDTDSPRTAETVLASATRRPSHMELPHRTGSPHTVRSEDEFTNGRSRVTSWTDSTAANTVAIKHAAEMTRLSVIEENGGPYQPSRRYRYAPFQVPIQSGNEVALTPPPIDSQRVFSALLKRLDESSFEAKEDQNTHSVGASHTGSRLPDSSIPPRGSSLEHRRTPDARKLQIPQHNAHPNQLERRITTNGSPNAGFVSRNSSASPKTLSDANSVAGGEDVTALGQVVMETLTESLRATSGQGSTISKSQLTSVPDPQARVRIPSQYRRATGNKAGFNQGSAEPQILLNQSETVDGRNQAVPRAGSAGASIVYSRTTSGKSPEIRTRTASLAHADKQARGGEVAGLSSTAQQEETGASASKQSSLCTKSSFEWQASLAFGVAGSQSMPLKRNPFGVVSRQKRHGHHRETAQINQTDVEVRSPTPSKQQLPTFHERIGAGASLEHQLPSEVLSRVDTNMPPTGVAYWERYRQESLVSPANDTYPSSPPEHTMLGVMEAMRKKPASLRSAASDLSLQSSNKRLQLFQTPPSVSASEKVGSSIFLGKSKSQQILRSRPTTNVGSQHSRHSPERARRLAAYQSINKKQLEQDANGRFNSAIIDLKENVHAGNIDQDLVDADHVQEGRKASSSGRRQYAGSSEDFGPAFL